MAPAGFPGPGLLHAGRDRGLCRQPPGEAPDVRPPTPKKLRPTTTTTPQPPCLSFPPRLWGHPVLGWLPAVPVCPHPVPGAGGTPGALSGCPGWRADPGADSPTPLSQSLPQFPHWGGAVFFRGGGVLSPLSPPLCVSQQDGDGHHARPGQEIRSGCLQRVSLGVPVVFLGGDTPVTVCVCPCHPPPPPDSCPLPAVASPGRSVAPSSSSPKSWATAG